MEEELPATRCRQLAGQQENKIPVPSMFVGTSSISLFGTKIT